MKNLILVIIAFCLIPFLLVAGTGGGGGIIIVPDDVECIGFSPNPTNDVAHIATLETSNFISHITIKNLAGTVLFEQSYQENACDIDFSFLATGEYIMLVKTQNCETLSRVIVTP